MATGGTDILLGGAVIVFVGVVASLIFERYRIPDVVLLLLVGILLGPIFGLLDPAVFGGFAEAFTTLALVVILFEGGLDLHVRLLKRSLAITTTLLFASYAATAAVIMLVVRFAAGFDWPIAILFGLVMAPLSSSILISLVGRLSILPETRALLTIESALGDVIAVLAVVTLADGLSAGGAVDVFGVVRTLGASFLVGGGLALLAGIAWSVVLRILKERPYAYLVTFALALVLLGVVDRIGGNGVVAVLVFALVLGNAERFAGWLPGVKRYEVNERIRWFHAEMSFFVRTFFFIYLGLLVSLSEFGIRFIVTLLLVAGAILAVRAALVWAIVRQRPRERQDAAYLSFLIPRGLASAALAAAPPVVALTSHTTFSDLSFALILLTNLIMTGFILWREHGFGTGAEPEAALVEWEHFAMDLEGLSELDEHGGA